MLTSQLFAHDLFFDKIKQEVACFTCVRTKADTTMVFFIPAFLCVHTQPCIMKYVNKHVPSVYPY